MQLHTVSANLLVSQCICSSSHQPSAHPSVQLHRSRHCTEAAASRNYASVDLPGGIVLQKVDVQLWAEWAELLGRLHLPQSLTDE